MIFGSVCSGIEAASVAWRPLGFRCAFASEIEAFPRAVLAHRQPDAPLHGDFTTIQAGAYEPIDLLVGGTPCQSFSIAGLRGGMADARGNLALEYLRLADRLRPRWVLWENVPGVLSSNGGRDFAAFLRGLAQLGYGFAWRVLDAQHFGLAQRRRRVFVVGCAGDWRRAAAVLLEPASLRGDRPPGRQARERTADTLTVGANQYSGFAGEPVEVADLAPTISARPTGCGGLGTDFDLDGGLIARPLMARHQRNDSGMETFVSVVAPALSSSNSYGDHESREGLLVAHALRGEGFDASEDGTGRGTPLVWSIRSDAVRDGEAKTPSPNGAGKLTLRRPGLGVSPDVAPTIDASAPHMVGPVSVALRGREGGATAEVGDDKAFTLRGSQGGGDKPHVLAADLYNQSVGDVSATLACGSAKSGSTLPGAVVGSAVRRLTPRECERLQGFPDDYTLIPWRGRPADECPDGPRYKALGNSMAVPVMRWIGARIARERAA